MPNPHYNTLKQPLKLEQYQTEYNQEKLYELFTMWLDYRQFNIKPWDFKDQILVEDIEALRIMSTIQKDIDIMHERAQKAREKTQTELNQSR